MPTSENGGARALVTGADGMLGVDVCQTLRRRGYEVDESTVDDMDVRDGEATRQRILQSRPSVVIHCAGYTNVDGAEDNRDLCFAINATGAGNVAVACRKAGARLVFISTDYVFDGTASAPYTEDAPTHPTGVYGASKHAGELAVREAFGAAAAGNFIIARVAWLHGVHCWKFSPNFIEKILAAAQKRPVLKVVDDQRGTPTFTFDVAEKIADLLPVDEGGVYHLTNEGEATWFDLARAALEEAGVAGVAVEPTTTASYGLKAPRPAYSVLDNAHLRAAGLSPMPDWRESMKEYFRRRVD